MYYNIAYLQNDRCLTVLSEAENEKAARAEFQEHNPDLKIVDIWERPDFAPATTDSIPPFVPTCNIHEAAVKFRTAGIPTSEIKLGAGIEQGLYPFAICIHTNNAKTGEKNRRFEIYTKLLDKYLAERGCV